MKNKEKQIEEMAKDIGYQLGITYEEEKLPFSLHTRDYLARALIEQGYRKLLKDNVVLSKEEYGSKLQDAYNNGVEFGKKCGSKETAEKIYKEYLCNILSLEAKEEFTKQFGVKINNSNSFNIDEFNKGYAQGIKDLKNSKRR